MAGPPMPFGKYKGTPINEVPDERYLRWVMTVATSEWLREAIQEDLDRREGKTPPPPGGGADLQELIARGRKLLARRYHPDRNGEPNATEVMKGINLMADWLRAEANGKRR